MNTQHAQSLRPALVPEVMGTAVEALLLPVVLALGARRLLRCLPATAGDRVLELACPGPEHLLFLAGRHRGLRLFGLDGDPARREEALRRASRAAAGADIRLAATLEDLDAPTAAPDGFDSVFRISADPLKPGELDRVVDLLKPNGFFLALDVGRPIWRSECAPAPSHSRLLPAVDAFVAGSTLATLAAASREGALTLSWDSLLGGRACLAVARKGRVDHPELLRPASRPEPGHAD